MAGNRTIYEQAMQMGYNAAWDQEWDKAIAAFGRAVQEFPEDPAAHNSLGLALLQARRLEDALKVYTRAHQLAPDDPIPLEKSADVLERLGRLKEAAQQYINVAEVYLAQRDLEKAIGNWERATRLTPGLVNIHQRLALAYERTGQRNNAIREYLTLAANFQSVDKSDVALQAVERALRIDPRNPQALNTKAAIEQGQPIRFEDRAFDVPPDPKSSQELEAVAPSLSFAMEEPESGTADPRGPLGEAIEKGLEMLAIHFFESGALGEGVTYASQAIELQRQNQYAQAIAAYRQALAANMRHPAIYLNMGAMQLEAERWADAIQSLKEASQDPILAAGAMHGMSKAYRALSDPRAAALSLVQSLRLADMNMAINEDEAAQLGAVYDRLLTGIDDGDEQQIIKMNESLLGLLSGASWKQRVPETRRQIQAASQEAKKMWEVLPYIHITEGLEQVDNFVRMGLFTLAMDQAHYMLESAPDYLPIHERIAQILLERNNIPGAITKYNVIASTYLMRSDPVSAANILQAALRIAPMDVHLHNSLIELLEQQEQWDQLLNQYIDLADAYYQLADLDSARATYQTAIQLAQRENAPRDQVIHIMHRMGDIDVSRLDLRQAMRTYEQIRKLDSDDERARRSLVDLNYRLSDPVSAVRELDGLLRTYAKEHRADRIIQILDELVTRYPKDMALRSRLAAVHRQTNNVEKAVEQLDALAELQLESGLHNDAIVTVRRIVAMNPVHVEDYQQLLQQLSG